MNSSDHSSSRAQQQEKISSDPLKTPATDTAAAQPHEIAEAARQQGRPAQAAETGAHGAHGNSQPARHNPNQPGSDAAALEGEHNAAHKAERAERGGKR